MANQDSTSNGFPEPYSFGYGSNAIVLGLNTTSGVPAPETSTRYGLTHVMNGESVSELHDPSPVRFQHLLAADVPVESSHHVVPHIDLNSEGREGEPHAAVLGQRGDDMNLSNGRLTNLPSFLQGDSSNNTSHGIHSNPTDKGYVIDTNRGKGIVLSLDPYGREGQDANENERSGNGSDSDPLVISSGTSRYVLEESENGEGGSTSEGTRLFCKRKAPESPSESANGSSTSTKQAVSAQETCSRGLYASPTPLNIQANENFSKSFRSGPAVATGGPFTRDQSSRVASYGFETGARAISNINQISRVLGHEYNSQRNIHLGGPVNQQGLSAWATSNTLLQSSGQTPTYFPLAQQPAGFSPGMMNSAPIMQDGLIPNSSQSPLPFQFNGIPMVQNPVSPTSAYNFLGRDGMHRQQQYWGNVAGQTIGLPEFQGSNLASPQNPNLNYPSWANFYRDIASSSREGPPQFSHQPTATWFPQHQGNMTEQYAPARFPGILNHMQNIGQSNYLPRHTGFSATAREADLSVPGGNARPSQMQQLSGPTIRGRRTGANTSLTVPRVSSAPWRSRLARNALNLVRRRVLYSLRDVIVIDRSVLLGIADDQHESMRMDVDNMSYEELLALEEKIGNVSTGLTENAICAHMNRRKYQLAEAGSSVDEEPCCICQEEYAEGEDLGKLKCGHDFHFDCIKQWLVLKNSCPICKTTGLDV